MLKIENLRAYYASIPALKGVSIEVPKGKMVSIIGANGAGKSTLLKSISGLMKSKEGQIQYKDQDISALDANKIVSETKYYSILRGVRGEKSSDIPALIETILKINQLITDFKDEILEFDCNPAFVYPKGKGCQALDVKITIKK